MVVDTRIQLVNFIILTSNVLGLTSRRNYHRLNDCILSVSRPGSTLNYRAYVSEGQFSELIRFNHMADVELSSVANGSAVRCRVVTRSGSGISAAANKQPLSATDSYNIEAAADAKLQGDSIDIGLIQRRTYLLSAGIGDTNRVFNRFKGWIGLVIWILNVIIHFGLDFYEAVFVFEVSWATCIGVFLITLLACCYSMIKHSVPWFIKGVRKLKKDGHYPKTLRRVYLMFKVSLCTLSSSS